MAAQSAGTILFPVLALGFALALLGYAVWITDRLPVPAPSSAAAVGRLRWRGRAVSAGAAPAVAAPWLTSRPASSGLLPRRVARVPH